MTTDTRRGSGAPEVRRPGVPPPHPLRQRLDSPLSTYYLLLGTVAVLVPFGLVMVLSASSVTSTNEHGSPYTLFLNQARFAVIGVVVATIAAHLPVLFWKRVSWLAVLVAGVLQLAVFTPLGVEVKGNRNWLNLGFMQLQPSELGKIALILLAATVLSTKRELLGSWLHAVFPVVVPVGMGMVGLVLLGRDLGTTLVLLAILAAVLWQAGVTWKLFAVSGVLTAAAVGAMVRFSDNRMGRIDQWLNCEDPPQGCWQSSQGRYALAIGGADGLGLGGSRQKWSWLPEAHNDFIFAVIGEELGLAGTLLTLLLFCLVAYACYRIVLRSNDMFVRIATAGVMVWVTAQAFINIGVVIGLLPVIGVPLPLISYGGSALVTTLLGLGMVISFARSEPECARALATKPALVRRSLSVLVGPRRAGRRGES